MSPSSFQIPAHLAGDSFRAPFHSPRAPFHSPAHSTCSFLSAPPNGRCRHAVLLCRRAGRTCSPQGVGAIPLTATHQGPTYSLRSALTPLALDALGPFSPHPASLAPRLSWERSLIRRGSHRDVENSRMKNPLGPRKNQPRDNQSLEGRGSHGQQLTTAVLASNHP